MSNPPNPGFYGKLPDFGDFLTRRVPTAALDIWDPFLRRLLQSSRARLGDSWLEAWLSAPVWHFGLGENLLFPTQAWGVLIPSVDRVGRHFPFTILGPAAPTGRPLRDWALAAEAQALAALDENFSPDTLDRALAALGPPQPRPPGTAPTQTPLGENPGDWPELLQTTPGPSPGDSLWWSRGTQTVLATLLRCENLPNDALAAAFIAGP
jgi:type VI secretion system protein ImpM